MSRYAPCRLLSMNERLLNARRGWQRMPYLTTVARGARGMHWRKSINQSVTVRRASMISDQLKTILDSLVVPSDRDFKVLLKPDILKRRGSYSHATRTIIIYGAGYRSDTALLATALHELAHHINGKNHERMWIRRRMAGQRIDWHGRTFVLVLMHIVSQANILWRKKLGGWFFFDPDHPRFSVEFTKNRTPRE
jgi:hypothetical protein